MFTLPPSPLGRADIVTAPPWHIAGDVIALEFWTEPSAAATMLPPGLTPDLRSNGRGLAIFADLQFTARNEELLDPARYQGREFCILVDAYWKRTPVLWTPFTYTDNDAALARGWIEGNPKRLGSIFQTRTFPAPGPAAATIAQGSRFGASLSVCGQRLANACLTLRRENADVSRIMERPIVHRRYFPNVFAQNRDLAVIDELVRAVPDDLAIIDVWSGDAELELPKALGEGLHELTPIRMGAGYRFSMSCSIGELIVLQDLTE